MAQGGFEGDGAWIRRGEGLAIAEAGKEVGAGNVGGCVNLCRWVCWHFDWWGGNVLCPGGVGCVGGEGAGAFNGCQARGLGIILIVVYIRRRDEVAGVI